MCDTPLLLDTDPVEHFHTLHEWSDRARSELSDIKKRLGLRLSVDGLVLAAGLYQRQDPSVGELRFVDALLATGRQNPLSVNIAAFQTKDKSLADAFARVLTHRRGALPNQPPTLTLADAGNALCDNTATAHLTTLARLVAMTLQGQYPTDAIRLNGTPWYLASTIPTAAYRPMSLQKGDLLTLVQIPEDAEFQAMRPLIDLFSDKKQQRRILRLCEANRGDLIPTLLSLSDGLEIDLSAIEGLADEPPYVAFDRLPTGILLCADQANTRKLCDEIRAIGFSASAFGRVSADRRLTLTTHGRPEFSLESLHLRLLLTPQPTSLDLVKAESAPPTAHHGTQAVSTDKTAALCSIPLVSPVDASDLAALIESMTSATAPSAPLWIGLVVSPRTPLSTLWATVLQLLNRKDVPPARPLSFAYTLDPNARASVLTLCQILPELVNPCNDRDASQATEAQNE
jgi:hypothetical protein